MKRRKPELSGRLFLVFKAGYTTLELFVMPSGTDNSSSFVAALGTH